MGTEENASRAAARSSFKAHTQERLRAFTQLPPIDAAPAAGTDDTELHTESSFFHTSGNEFIVIKIKL